MKFDRTRMITRRSRLNYTQEDLAGRAGVAVRSVAGWESGETQPTTKMLEKLAQALSVPAGWLLGEQSTMDPPLIAPKLPISNPPPTDDKGRRVLRRIAELNDVEWIKIEPAILSIIDAVISLRDPGFISDDVLREQMAAVHRAAGVPPPAFSSTSKPSAD